MAGKISSPGDERKETWANEPLIQKQIQLWVFHEKLLSWTLGMRRLILMTLTNQPAVISKETVSEISFIMFSTNSPVIMTNPCVCDPFSNCWYFQWQTTNWMQSTGQVQVRRCSVLRQQTLVPLGPLSWLCQWSVAFYWSFTFAPCSTSAWEKLFCKTKRLFSYIFCQSYHWKFFFQDSHLRNASIFRG